MSLQPLGSGTGSGTGGGSGSSDGIAARVRKVLKQHAGLVIDADALAPESPLDQAGMSSFSSVNVMLALEAEFSIEFPDRMLTRAVFSSVESISRAVLALCSPESRP